MYLLLIRAIIFNTFFFLLKSWCRYKRIYYKSLTDIVATLLRNGDLLAAYLHTPCKENLIVNLFFSLIGSKIKQLKKKEEK